MDFDQQAARLAEVCPGAIVDQVTEVTKDPFVVIDAEHIVDVMDKLQTDAEFRFDFLIDIAGVDYPDVMPKAKKLRTGGLYRFYRHPIYMGNQVFAIGVCILLGSWIALILCFVVLIPVNIFRAKYEERLLVEEFGDEYREFQKRTLF